MSLFPYFHPKRSTDTSLRERRDYFLKTFSPTVSIFFQFTWAQNLAHLFSVITDLELETMVSSQSYHDKLSLSPANTTLPMPYPAHLAHQIGLHNHRKHNKNMHHNIEYICIMCKILEFIMFILDPVWGCVMHQPLWDWYVTNSHSTGGRRMRSEGRSTCLADVPPATGRARPM